MLSKIQNITNKQAKNKVLSLFLCLLLTPGATFAQQDKKITIQKQNISVIEALKQVGKQTGMSVGYNNSQLKGKEKTNLSLRNVLLAANVLKQQPRVLFVFTHDVFLLLPGRAGIFELVHTGIFELVHTSSPYSHRIPDLFIQVNMLLQKSIAECLFSALLTSCPLEI